MNDWLNNHRLTLPKIKWISMALILVGSLAFVGWTSGNTFLAIQQSQASIQTVRNFEHEISRLQVQYQEAHLDSLQTNLEQADQQLMKDFTHLAQWAQELQEQAERIALRMQYRVLKGKQSPSSIQGIALIPITLQVSPRDNRSGYQAYLAFLKSLHRSGPRIDFHEVTMTGDGEKATHLTIGLSLWMKTQDFVEL